MLDFEWAKGKILESIGDFEEWKTHKGFHSEEGQYAEALVFDRAVSNLVAVREAIETSDIDEALHARLLAIIDNGLTGE